MIPTLDRQAARLQEASYANGAGMSRQLNSQLPAFEIAERKLVQGSGPLLSAVAASYWTEHSQRATLVTWASMVGSFPTAWLDQLGRWGSDGSSGYDRSYRSRAQRIQERVAHEIRTAADPHDLLDEAEVFEALQAFLEARKVSSEEILPQMGRLHTISPHRKRGSEDR